MPEKLYTVQDILDFYQARCFFGLLNDMYCIAGRKLDVESYVERQEGKAPSLTTKSLLPDLYDISSQACVLDDESKTEKYLQIDECIESTEELTFLLQLSVAEDLKHRQQWSSESDTTGLSDLWTMQIAAESTAMLRETVLSSARQIYMPSSISLELASRIARELPPAPENMLCMERFKTAGWCPRHALEAAQTTLKSRSILFALSSIDRTKAKQDHSHCSTDECEYDHVDNDTYQTQHSPDCTGRDCPLMPRNSGGTRSRASAIISRCVTDGCVPVISLIERPNNKSSLSIKSYQLSSFGVTQKHRRQASDSSSIRRRREKVVDSSTPDYEDAIEQGSQALQTLETGHLRLPYIAISHVWSQGLGNRRANAIRLCQLRRLQHFVNLIVPPQYRPIPFWIDTICVPLSRGPREMAIKSMRTVYRDAMTVLVVDSTLTELEETIGNRELLLRIKAAPWTQRLWTYQEACLARHLYFQVGGLDKVAVWSQKLVTGDRGTNGVESETNIDVTAGATATATATPSPGPDLDSQLPNFADKYHLLEYVAAYLLTEAASLQLFGSSGPEEFHDLRYLSRQLALRTTSRLEDEAICVSTLLGLEPAQVTTAANGSILRNDERMKRLWEILPAERVPGEILFCNRPFYEEIGCGWMPKSLLRDQTGNQVEHLGCDMAIRKHPEHGILVQMEGLIFDVDAAYGLGSNTSSMEDSQSLWDVVLVVEGWLYRISKVEASEKIPSSRSSVRRGTFAVLIPSSELRDLVEEVEDRVEGSGSHTTELPFGVLVNVLEGSSCSIENLDGEVDKDTIFAIRREMVEFEVVLEDEEEEQDNCGSDGEDRLDQIMGSEKALDTHGRKGDGRKNVMIEAKILPKTQKWFVG